MLKEVGDWEEGKREGGLGERGRFPGFKKEIPFVNIISVDADIRQFLIGCTVMSDL